MTEVTVPFGVSTRYVCKFLGFVEREHALIAYGSSRLYSRCSNARNFSQVPRRDGMSQVLSVSCIFY